MNDSQIWAALEPLYPKALEDIPVDGDWLQPPFADDPAGRAIVLNDGDFQFVVVDREQGGVLYVCEDDESVIASSLDRLIKIVELWGSIDRDAVGPEDDDDFSRVTKSFEDELKRIDPIAAGPNEFWYLYAEELTSEDYVDIDDLDEADDSDEMDELDESEEEVRADSY